MYQLENSYVGAHNRIIDSNELNLIHAFARASVNSVAMNYRQEKTEKKNRRETETLISIVPLFAMPIRSG